MPEGVEGAHLDERLEDALVDEPEVDPVAEVGERPEGALCLAGGDDRLDGALPDVLDGQQAEPDRRPLDGELQVAGVDVRLQHGDAEPAALGHGRGDLLGVVPERRQDAGHVLDGVVGLEVRRLVGDQPVGRGVGLVEAVALERLEGLEDRVDRVRAHPALARLAYELVLHRAQDARLLLADRVAERVRLGAAEAAEGGRGGHDVLLVDEDPVGPLEEWLEERVEVGDLLLAVLAPDVGRDVLHRARPVEGDHGGEVVDRGRPELADVAPHPRRLQLEDAGRLARGQEGEGRRVVEGDPLEVDLDAALLPDPVHGGPQDRQVGEAQEVELEEPQRLDPVHLVLGHRGVGVRGLLERHQLGQGLAADDDARGVGGGVAGHPSSCFAKSMIRRTDGSPSCISLS